jgi:hypothetical protein
MLEQLSQARPDEVQHGRSATGPGAEQDHPGVFVSRVSDDIGDALIEREQYSLCSQRCFQDDRIRLPGQIVLSS